MAPPLPTSERWTPSRVRELRARHGMTQEEFAPYLGYTSGRRVSELERERRKVKLTAQTERLLDYVDRNGLLPPALVGVQEDA